MNEKKVVIIANPRAGGGNATQLMRQGQRGIWGREVVAYQPLTPRQLQNICEGIDPELTEGIVVIGGDGTMNRVIQELIRQDKQVPLYPFPCGTANDLSLELRTQANWDAVENSLNQARTDRIDLISVNGIPFATVAGIGVGARLTSELNLERDRSWLMQFGVRGFKRQLYSLLSFKTILFDSSIYEDLRIESGCFNQTLRSPAVFICNQNRLAGSMVVAQQSGNSDGKFSVLIVPEINRARLTSSLVQLHLGTIPPNFIVFATDQLQIHSQKGIPIRVFGDGDTLVESPHLHFEILKRRLPVFRGDHRMNSSREDQPQ